MITRFDRAVLRAQAAYYGATGLWPLVHMRSFEAVTGPKNDDWLVRMVGLLTVAIGGALWPRASTGAIPSQIRALAIGAAASYFAIDLVYSARRVISPIYLLDAVAETGLLLAHGFLWKKQTAAS